MPPCPAPPLSRIKAAQRFRVRVVDQIRMQKGEIRWRCPDVKQTKDDERRNGCKLRTEKWGLRGGTEMGEGIDWDWIFSALAEAFLCLLQLSTLMQFDAAQNRTHALPEEHTRPYVWANKSRCEGVNTNNKSLTEKDSQHTWLCVA